MLVAGTFISYRHYHDRFMYRLGYEIQDDFDTLLGWGEEEEHCSGGGGGGGEGEGGGGGMEMLTHGGRGPAFMRDEQGDGEGDDTLSALRI